MAKYARTTRGQAADFATPVVPRLANNGAFLGPEYAGFTNSGRRPKIVRRDGFYIVGPDGSVERLLPAIAARRSEGVFKDWRTVSHSNVNVFVFKDRKPAVAKFAELCKQVLDWNRA